MADKERVLTTGFGMPVENDLKSMTAGPSGPGPDPGRAPDSRSWRTSTASASPSAWCTPRAPARTATSRSPATSPSTPGPSSSRQVGKKTEVFVRFSTVGGEKGSADSERDPRGFAVKFYTEEGNYDMVGNNTPVFFIRDPLKFPDFIHTQKRNPATNLKDPDMFWDFLSLTPESIHQVTILFSDRGTPRELPPHERLQQPHLHVVQRQGRVLLGQVSTSRPSRASRTSRGEEAARMRGEDPDHATRDLFDAIAAGRLPVLARRGADHDAASRPRTTASIPSTSPRSGRTPTSRSSRSAAWCSTATRRTTSPRWSRRPSRPATSCPASGPRPTRCCRGGCSATTTRTCTGSARTTTCCRSTRRRRRRRRSYQRDGAMRLDDNGGGGAQLLAQQLRRPGARSERWPRRPSTLQARPRGIAYALADVDFVQAGDLYRKVMNDEEREHLVGNIVAHLGKAQRRIQLRQTALFYKADPEYGERVAKGLGLNMRRSSGWRRCRRKTGSRRPQRDRCGSSGTTPPASDLPAVRRGQGVPCRLDLGQVGRAGDRGDGRRSSGHFARPALPLASAGAARTCPCTSLRVPRRCTSTCTGTSISTIRDLDRWPAAQAHRHRRDGARGEARRADPVPER